ncbi:MAG TPA: PQQ-dependent sugar dehydrogenase, partial [Pyrinomonadaceae bacterium]
MLKTILVTLVSLYLLSNTSDSSLVTQQQDASETGILEKLIVANGKVTMDVDLNRLGAKRSKPGIKTLRFNVAPNSFFTILVFNRDFRGIEPGSMMLVPQSLANVPDPLKGSFSQLVIESTTWGQPFELVVRDEKTGFVFFNIEAQEYEYAANERLLNLNQGKLQLSKEFASALGRPSETGSVVGTVAVSVVMRPIEITQVVNGEAKSSVMPSVRGLDAPFVAGPDVIVGDLSGLAQFGSSSGTQVGLAVGTDSCNAGAVPLNWFALPNNDHPVIPQNLYRMSGGTTNDDRFEQVGQSAVKHAFTALQQDICGFGCSATPSTTLGSGCSDPYTASLNSGGSTNSLGSRAWINPFTGAYPRGDSATPPNSHSGHTHSGPSHRILVEMNDLNTTLNPGATYFAEAQYVTPHEYAWCQAHPGECNMANNASHRKYTVTGTTSFTFTPVGSTVRSKPAISAWPGATSTKIEPDPGNDGIGFVAYKVTHPSPTVWHYEYAVYNENLDRAIQSFAVPLGAGTVLSNIGFHAPPQHPAWANDGTVGSAGYSSAPWTPTQSINAMTWTSETFAQNQNANAIRWGTLYNFRFDSDRPPQTTNATVGFYKTGAPIVVQIQGPDQGPVLPTLSINDVTLTEGNAGTTTANFTVTLSSSSLDTVSVQYATANGLATAGSDYISAGGTVNFTPGQTTQPVSVTVNGDGLEELNETFFVNLTNPVNATVNDAQGVGTINNDDVLASLPPGFGETQINGLSNPTAMAIHPDGRIFVCEQTGALRVIKNGALLPTPFTTVTVNSSGERGLLGITFDPNYVSNRFIYVYYTATTPTIHNRVSRFTADIVNEDIAQVGSEVALLDLETLGATNHDGGAIHFGPDGKLYIAVGENAVPANAQSLSNRLGKMLRINSDGTIPADNPTTFPNIAGSPTGNNRAIWAVGLRNPFTFSFQPGTGRMHINDVGQNTWEEVDLGIAGANYGWPTCEGTCGTAGMTNPIYQYSSADAVNCAITGCAFYNPTTATFPAQYIGKYFFADFCGGWLKTLDPLSPPAIGTAPDFATGINAPVDIQVANDGSLYYLARGSNSVFRIQYFGNPTVAINDVSITEGNSGTSTATFTVLLSPASSQTVTVNYATADNSALAGSDYVAASGTVTFLPGQT